MELLSLCFLASNLSKYMKNNRKSNISEHEFGYILDKFAVFWKHSESIWKAFGKETFRSQLARSIQSILNAYWNQSGSQRKAYGVTLQQNPIRRAFGQFKKITQLSMIYSYMHYIIMSAKNRPVFWWTMHYIIPSSYLIK